MQRSNADARKRSYPGWQEQETRIDHHTQVTTRRWEPTDIFERPLRSVLELDRLKEAAPRFSGKPGQKAAGFGFDRDGQDLLVTLIGRDYPGNCTWTFATPAQLPKEWDLGLTVTLGFIGKGLLKGYFEVREAQMHAKLVPPTG